MASKNITIYRKRDNQQYYLIILVMYVCIVPTAGKPLNALKELYTFGNCQKNNIIFSLGVSQHTKNNHEASSFRWDVQPLVLCVV